MDLIAVLTLIGVALANIGTTVTLFTWATNHAAQDNRESRRILESIQQEMKDFHGRLCAIEERRGK